MVYEFEAIDPVHDSDFGYEGTESHRAGVLEAHFSRGFSATLIDSEIAIFLHTNRKYAIIQVILQ